MVDWDKFFYYDTKQIVRIRDRYLGFTLYFLYGLMWTYIVFGVFIYGEGYLSYDLGRGGIATHVKGDTVATSATHGGKRYYSAEEITFPGLENGNVFVATRETVTKQKRGTCDHKDMHCVEDSDCSTRLGGKCSEHGYCNEPGWCTPEGEVADKYDLDTMHIEIWIKSFMHYSLLDRKANMDIFASGLKPPFIYSTINQNHTQPEAGYNLFSVNELLRMCKPVPVRYEEIAELGAAIEVIFSWECNMHRKDCEPVIKARRLDVLFDPEKIGFSFERADYISEDERMLHELRGVRIFFQTVGKGSMVDVNAFILKLATTTSLLCLAPILADLLMLNWYKEQKRYNARKYQRTQNFSEVRARHKAQAEKEGDRRKSGLDQDREDQNEIAKQEEAFRRRLREENDDD